MAKERTSKDEFQEAEISISLEHSCSEPRNLIGHFLLIIITPKR